MIYFWIVYMILFIMNPIIVIKLNKKYSGSMHLDTFPDQTNRLFYFAFFSFAWPLCIFMEFYLLLDYWYKQA